MRVLKQTDRYVSIDDVPSPEQFALMLESAARSDYARGKILDPQDPRKAYPTGMAVDLLLKKILDSKFYREKVPDTYVTARTYLHPPGSGLDWHDDEGRFAGAYTYYVHPRWRASWGGELWWVGSGTA